METLLNVVRNIVGQAPDGSFGPALEYTIACCLMILVVSGVIKILVKWGTAK